MFADYLLVTDHTGESLMGQIYDDAFIKKLRLAPANIREQCTGAAFDETYFHMSNPDHIAKQIVKQAKGPSTTRSEIRNLVKWVLYTWEPAHRLELVANDLRIDKLGVDVERMFVPSYAQIPKDIACMHICLL